MRSVSAKALCFWGDVSLVKFHWRPLLYISFYIVLIGAEINAELELQTAKDTTAGRPRPMGERGAFVADHVAGGPDGHKRPVSPVSRDPAAAKPGGS